jgi:hypothetical protein
MSLNVETPDTEAAVRGWERSVERYGNDQGSHGSIPWVDREPGADFMGVLSHSMAGTPCWSFHRSRLPVNHHRNALAFRPRRQLGAPPQTGHVEVMPLGSQRS